MKKCIQCGESLPDDARFCAKCGAPQPAGGNRNKQIGLIVVLAVVVAAAVIGFFVVRRNMPATIDLSKYVSISVSGYAGVGEADVEVDEDAWARDVANALASKGVIRKTDAKNIGNWNDFWAEAENAGRSYLILETIADACDYSIGQTEGLSNGDTVTVSFTYDNDAVKDYKIRFKGDTVEQTVSGLEEAKTFDAFENVEVSFSGISPDGTAEVSATDSVDQGLSYSFDVASGLSNGDTVTLQVSPLDTVAFDSDFLDRHGAIPEETTKEYTVSGLDEYVSEMQDISADAVQDMQAEAEDYMNAAAARWDDRAALNDLEYEGAYLLTEKQPDSYGYGFENRLLLIYKENVTVEPAEYSDDQETETEDIYIAYIFNNLIKKSDGSTEVDYNDTDVADGNSVEINYLYFNGYDSVDALVKDYVTQRIDEYNVESTFGDE